MVESYLPGGDEAVLRSVEGKLRELGRGDMTDYIGANDAEGNRLRLIRAFIYQSSTRPFATDTGPWGVGKLSVPKGRFAFNPVTFHQSQMAMAVGGECPYATTLDFSILDDSLAAFRLNPYGAVRIHDLTLTNTAVGFKGSAFDLNGINGGALLQIERVEVAGFYTAIKVSGAVNADKSLIEQVTGKCQRFFDQGTNKQAIGWTFLNCGTDMDREHFVLGGAGEVLIANYTSNVRGSLIKYPEGAGNPGTHDNVYLGSRTTVMSTKLENHGTGDRMMVDARECLKLTNEGGSNVDLVFRETSIAPGDPITWATHTIIQVGNATQGCDAIRIKQEGGTIRGVIKVGSNKTAAAENPQFTTRWSFRDAVKAPPPETVQFLGVGYHPLMEWRANENVRLDQYRGGQGAQMSIDSQKSFLMAMSGRNLIDTTTLGNHRETIGGRVGKRFAIELPNSRRDNAGMGGGYPYALIQQLGLRVFLDDAVPFQVQIQQFSDPNFTNGIAAPFLTPAGQRGLFPVNTYNAAITDGKLYVEITTPALDQVVPGRLVFDYFPYLGA